jgi:outer membrane lipoprotein-sorting protein
MMRLIFVAYILLFANTSDVFSQAASSILKKHFEAHQHEFWAEIQTLSAHIEWNGDQGHIRGDLIAKRPDKVKIYSERQGFAEAYDGIEGWTIAEWTNNKIIDLEFDRALMLREVVKFGSALDPKINYEYKGTVEVDNIPCYWFSKRDQSRTYDYFIAQKTHLLFKTNITSNLDQQIIFSRTVTKYRDIHGIKFSTVVVVKTPIHESEYVFHRVVLGDGIPNSSFQKPNG